MSFIKIMIPLAKQIPGVSVIATAVETALATAQVVTTQVIKKGEEKVHEGQKVAGRVGQLVSSLPTAAASAAAASASLAAASASPMPLTVSPPMPLTVPPPMPLTTPPPMTSHFTQRRNPQTGKEEYADLDAKGPRVWSTTPPPQLASVIGTMVGGGRETSYNSLEYLTLGSLAALVGGGLLVGINRVLQNYTYRGKDDSPPNAGRV